MSRVRPAQAVAVIAAVYVVWSACGDPAGYSRPSPPDPQRLTVTITNEGVTPAAIQASQRLIVEFVNVSDEMHDIRSDPHPDHTACPALNLVGEIPPGNRVANLTPIESGRFCKYHDETRPNDARFQGSIVAN